MKTLIINQIHREKRYAVLNDHKVEKLIIDQPKQHSSVGNIYLGIVEKVLPGMNAAFVSIGEEKSGYLHRDKLASFIQSDDEMSVKAARSISSYVHQGEKFLVQVEKDAAGTKGPRLTGIIELPGTHLIYMPHGRYVAVSKKFKNDQIREEWRRFGQQMKDAAEGIVFRTSCENQTQEELLEELINLRLAYKELLTNAGQLKKAGRVLERNSFAEEIIEEVKRLETGEVIVDDLEMKRLIQKNSQLPVKHYTGKENIFSAYRIEHEIEKAMKRIVWLENGAYLIFDEAEALTVIDVNTGKFAGKTDLRETILKTNKAAAEEVARQIRLRDIGGMVLIDFIDMKEERDRKSILTIMEAALKKDERRTNLIGFSPLGILQMTRKKTKPAISEAMTVKCASCEGTGRVLSSETIAFRLERELWEHRGTDYEAVYIDVTEEVERIFSGDHGIHKKRIEEQLGMKIIFTVINKDKPFYEIRQFGEKQ
ncbi:Rne/Rng family ribonuclease [Cytobacillus massiliigabonensis]|uniref:Rne/Rng family ribonuclease n=1 Tax=Cytobacillus massiliigabonensis TaxID=1871011 RepID=UPI000C84E97B|nr:Rne/Rng family ribonuclease [Cytobacillus massiliigabonensis]